MTIENLINKYENACHALMGAFELKQNVELDFWVANDIGGIACFGGVYFFDLDDIITDLREKAPPGKIFTWHDEELDKQDTQKVHVNYKKYLKLAGTELGKIDI